MKKKVILCKHWIELDNDNGQLFEYCRGKERKCICSGVKSQCQYLNKFKKAKQGL